MKIEPRLEALRKITQDLTILVERSIGGLSSQIGELAAAIGSFIIIRPDTEQAERLIKVESKLATVESILATVKGNVGEIKKGRESDSKKLDAVLALLTSK